MRLGDRETVFRGSGKSHGFCNESLRFSVDGESIPNSGAKPDAPKFRSTTFQSARFSVSAARGAQCTR